MAQSVKLADDVMALVRRESHLHSRSIAGQIAHWIKIGRAIERSEAFDYQRIAAALEAALPPDQLTAEEQEVWFAEFGQAVTAPSGQEKAFFAGRRRLGQGVGLTDNGELVYQTPDEQ
ncbi:MAG: TA system antitoxin ParD family protein [Alphaproteobacteria bacterium]